MTRSAPALRSFTSAEAAVDRETMKRSGFMPRAVSVTNRLSASVVRAAISPLFASVTWTRFGGLALSQV